MQCVSVHSPHLLLECQGELLILGGLKKRIMGRTVLVLFLGRDHTCRLHGTSLSARNDKCQL